MFGSTARVPSARHQNFHIGTSRCTLPVRSLTVIRFGSSSMFQKLLTHGPAPITTVSQPICPRLVLRPVTDLEFDPNSKPSTSTPERIETPSPLAFAARPSMLARLLA